jgi:predicted porin
MRKILLAPVWAAALIMTSAGHAETTFYGSFRAGLQYTDPDAAGESSNWDVTNEFSRWGLLGSEDLGNGLSAIYRLETGFSIDEFNGDDFAGRLAWVGLRGNFGEVKLGSQWTPYYNVAGVFDVFNATGFQSYNGPFRQNNAVVYATPDSIGFVQGEVMMVMNGEIGKDSIDSYNLGVNFEFGPAGFGAAYLEDRVADTDQWVVVADVTFGDIFFGGLYEDYEDGENWQLLGEYAFGNNVVRGQYGQNRRDDDSNLDEWTLGFDHFFSSSKRVWIEYSDRDDNEALINVGMRHDF